MTKHWMGQAQHLERKAILYVRQSSTYQVSQKLQ